MTRFLVADDDHDNRTLMMAVLTSLGLEVVGAATGDAALAAVRSQQLDGALLDVLMPGLSGVAVCHEIRTHPDLRKLPVLLISACATPEDIQLGLAAGADDYLVKPFRISEFVRRVTALLPGGSGVSPADSARLAARAAMANRPTARYLSHAPIIATA